MIILFSVWSLAYGEQIVQVTHGWCSPAVANVKGDVYIKCIGVSPNAHKKLNEELRKLKRNSNLKIQDLVAQADNWARKYHELSFQVAQLNNSSDKIKKISRLILDGDLDAAASQLDSAISQQEQQIGYLAELHYLRAYTYSFELNMPEALKHNELAYRYAPSNPKYIVSYARALFDNGQLVTSETLLNDNLPKLLTLVRHGSIQDYMYVATALDTLGAITASMRRTDVSFLSEFVSEFLNASKNMNSKTNDQK